MVGLRVIGVMALLCMGLAGYCIKALLSDGREYSELSLDYWLLTPGVIKAVGRECTNKALFTYSSADGPKPMVAQLVCNIQPESIIKIAQGHGFSENGYASFKKEGAELDLSVREGGSSTITLVEYP